MVTLRATPSGRFLSMYSKKTSAVLPVKCFNFKIPRVKSIRIAQGKIKTRSTAGADEVMDWMRVENTERVGGGRQGKRKGGWWGK